MLHSSSGDVLATGEHMLLHVNTNKGKACPFGKILYEKLAQIWNGHQNLSIPNYAGKGLQEINKK